MSARTLSLVSLLSLSACGEQPSLEGSWVGSCSGEFELDVVLVLDAEGVGTIVTQGELDHEQDVSAELEGAAFALQLDEVKVSERPDEEHGGTISTYNTISLEGTLGEGLIEGSCWLFERNSDAEDDSDWWYEASLDLALE